MTDATDKFETASAVIIAEEDEAVLTALTLQLVDKGWEVATADTTTQAWETYSDHSVGIVLVGVGADVEDWLALARKLRERTPELIIILMTGYAALDAAQDELYKAANDILVKPVRVDPLITSIRRIQWEQALIRENQELRQAIAKLESAQESGAAAQDRSTVIPEKGLAPAAMGSSLAGQQAPGSSAIASYEQHAVATPTDAEPETELPPAGSDSQSAEAT